MLRVKREKKRYSNGGLKASLSADDSLSPGRMFLRIPTQNMVAIIARMAYPNNTLARILLSNGVESICIFILTIHDRVSDSYKPMTCGWFAAPHATSRLVHYQFVCDPSRRRRCGGSANLNVCAVTNSSLTSTPKPGPSGTGIDAPSSMSCTGNRSSS